MARIDVGNLSPDRIEEIFEAVALLPMEADQAAALRDALSGYVGNPGGIVSAILPQNDSRHPCARLPEDKNAEWKDGYCKLVLSR